MMRQQRKKERPMMMHTGGMVKKSMQKVRKHSAMVSLVYTLVAKMGKSETAMTPMGTDASMATVYRYRSKPLGICGTILGPMRAARAFAARSLMSSSSSLGGLQRAISLSISE
jgi:hypothetical protein